MNPQHFLVDQPVGTKSVYLQFTYTPHLQHLSNLRPFGIQLNVCDGVFMWKQSMF